MKLTVILLILTAVAVVLAACGLFNAASAAAGNEKAATPEAAELARKVDEAVANYWAYILGTGWAVDRGQQAVRKKIKQRRERAA